MATNSGNDSPAIALPTGGGAQRGIGETFAPDLQTGTGNFTIPITIPAGRNGFQPQLNLIYSSGNGNGPFGLGWRLSVPGITRKTAKGVPRYRDAATEPDEWDTFILSGAEDLVPLAEDERLWFRPRTEGLFAQIERFRGDVGDYWEVRSKDGLISHYGTPRPNPHDSSWRDPATINDPAKFSRIFEWKLSQTEDPFGNRIVYDYRTDKDPRPSPRWVQSYLERIQYINYGDPKQPKFLISVIFDYEARPDAFSSYRAGFELHTRLRCSTIMVATHAGQNRTVRTYHLTYEQASLNEASLLRQIELIGADGIDRLPPLEFGYTHFDPRNRRDLFPVTGPDMPPASLARPDYELVDVSGDGLPDVVQLNGTARIWRNLGSGRFDRPTIMSEAPPGIGLADPGVQLMDADGDGRMDLVVTQNGLAGIYPLRFDGRWDRGSFRPFQHAPSFSLEDPEVKLVDLDGDGVPDLLRAGNRLACSFYDPDQATWQELTLLRPGALEALPAVSFADPRIKWENLSGDGLQDLVMIHSGSVCYWPNLGHGSWAPPVTMRNSPRLPRGYNPERLLLGDVDGDGLADLIYVEDGRVTLWVNRSGTAWSDAIVIDGTPSVTDADAVRLVDLLGSGIRGVLWTADATLNGLPRANMHFLDLTGAAKPYLLNRMDNHLGAVTLVEYRPSTVDYLRDAAQPEKRWQTSLPFPVQVVGRVEVIDAISRGKLTTEYCYHHGYWDGGEREFRGFGMVEQFDTEDRDRFNSNGLHGEADFAKVGESEPARFSPPTLTKTWFHLGPVEDASGDWDELNFHAEYWQEDPAAFPRHHTVVDLLKTYDRPWEQRDARWERRDMLRALRGRILRTELYAVDPLDHSPWRDRPYTVTDSQYGIREEASTSASMRRRIFFPFLVVQRTTQWERGHDPQTQLAVTDAHDAYGQPTARTTIALPRRSTRRQPVTGAVVGVLAGDDVNETRVLATHTRTMYARVDQNSDRHMVDRIAHVHTFEQRQPPGVTELDENDLRQVLRDGFDTAAAVHDAFMTSLDAWQPGQPVPTALRLTGHTINHYDGAAFSGLRAGKLGPYGALTRTETLVFLRDEQEADDDHLDNAFGARRPTYLGGTAAMPAGAPTGFGADIGYRLRTRSNVGYLDGYYADTIIRRLDTQVANAAQRWGVVVATRDPLGNELQIEPDEFWLLPAKVIDPVGLTTLATYDPTFLLPEKVTDANGRVTRYAYTPLGLLAKVILDRGTTTKPEIAYSYDFGAYDRTREKAQPQPIWVQTLQRIWHAKDGGSDDVIETREYSDGFGRLIQKRAQADELVFGGDGGNVGLLVGGKAVAGKISGPAVGRRGANRVIVSGWQTYDNKGLVVERYEPFFSTGWEFQPESEAKWGRHAKLTYDPRGQLVRTLNPDGSEQRIVFGMPPMPTQLDDLEAFDPSPWETYTYDANDLAPLSIDPDGDSLESRVPAAHHFTPASTITDALGRSICQVVRNGPDPTQDWFVTRSNYDLRGNLLTVWDALGRPAFRHAYDLQNRVLRVESIDAGTRTSVIDASGNLVEFRDDKGAIALRQYDSLNRLTALWARDGKGVSVTLRERLEYGDGGDPNQPKAARATNRSRNRLGRLYRHYDEAGLHQCNRYDFKGNVVEKTRCVVSDTALKDGWTANWAAANAAAALDTTVYQTNLNYDALNRPVEIVYPKQAAGPAGHRAVLRPGYNRAGALERVELDGIAYIHRIAYNAKGQRLLIVHGNGVMTRLAYAPDTFRLVRLRSERVQNPTPANDSWQGQGQPLQDLTYGYDLAGNIMSIEERVPGCGVAGSTEGRNRLTRRFAYDPLYRLTKATGRACADIGAPRPTSDAVRCGAFPPPYKPGSASPSQANAPDLTERYTETYAYDPAGNLLTLAYQPASPGNGWTRRFGLGGQAPADWAEAPNNRLTRLEQGAETHNYQYDANGNLEVENSERRYSWDHADRLTGFTVQPAGAARPSVEARYIYGADGQRVKKWIRTSGTGNGDSTIYVDGLFEHVSWKKPGQAAQQNNLLHVIDGKQRIALVRRGPAHESDAGPEEQYHLSDHLGSSVVVDESGGWINREEYFPYGETSFGSYAHKRYRFIGKERDEESGLAYHGARYYAPACARWISCDPLGAADGCNLYAYVKGNPINFVDPAGLQRADAETPTKDEAAVTISLHAAKEVVKGANTITDPAGVRLSGTNRPYNLWSTRLGEHEARANGFVEADTARGQATRATIENWISQGRYPPEALDNPRLLTPDDFDQTWRRTSRELARMAALSETPVGNYGPDTGIIKMTEEIPRVQKYGAGMGALTTVSGVASMYAGATSDNTAVLVVGTVGGTIESTGGLMYGLGALTIDPKLMAMGSGLSRFGGGPALIFTSGYGLYRNYEQGDVAASVGNAAGATTGILMVAGASSAAAVMGAFALGYGVGTGIDTYLIKPYWEPGTGAAGDWWYETFLKSGDWW